MVKFSLVGLVNKVACHIIIEGGVDMLLTLDLIVKSTNVLLKDTYHQICDKHLNFLFVGDQFASLCSIDQKSFINNNLKDLECDLQSVADKYNFLNGCIINGKRKTVNYLLTFQKENQLYILKNYVTPIIIDNVIQGVFIQTDILNIMTNLGLDLLFKAANQQILVHDLNLLRLKSNKELNDIEEFILFLISIGKTDKEITSALNTIGQNLSTPALSKFITRKIYPKMMVHSRNQLVNKVFKEGFSYPKLLLDNLSSLKILSQN